VNIESFNEDSGMYISHDGSYCSDDVHKSIHVNMILLFMLSTSTWYVLTVTFDHYCTCWPMHM